MVRKVHPLQDGVSSKVIQMLDVKNFREERGVTAKQMVDVIREQYPKYDIRLHIKVERPEEYGVRLVNDAERLLEEAFAHTAPRPRRPDRRRLPKRIQCRLSTTHYERLQKAFREEGFETIQQGLQHLILRYLKEEAKHA